MDTSIKFMLGFFMSGMLTICLGLFKVANGRLSRKVSEDTCNANVENMNKRFDDIKEYMNERFNDLKETVKNGGK